MSKNMDVGSRKADETNKDVDDCRCENQHRRTSRSNKMGTSH